MNKKLFFLLAFLGAAMIVLSPACKKDEECDFGFEKDADGDCTIEWSAKFLGSYLGNDVCGGQTFALNKPAIITRVSESSISISNFGGFDSIIAFDLTDSDRVEFTNATDPSGRKFTGSAQISGNTLSGEYRVTYSDNTFDDCTFTYTK